MFRFVTFLRCCAPTTLLAAALAAPLLGAADDGKRAVDVPRFGVHVRVPQAWDLVDWSHDDTAFVLDLPQDKNSKVGHVRCTLSVAPESLEAYQKQFANEAAAADAAPTPAVAIRRKLLKNEISPLREPATSAEIAARFGRRLTAEWEVSDAQGAQWFERRTYAIADGLLYAFTLDSDEAHYAAYSLDFEEMFAAAEIETLEYGLTRLPTGHWMQRDFRFAMKLPTDWRPGFGASERVLFFAFGAAHGLFTDNLIVLASPRVPLDLEKLRDEMPGDVNKIDAEAEVACRVVPQGDGAALETLVHTTRGNVKVTILERRFQTRTRNYEVKFTCEAKEFARREAELRAVLDGFAEVADEAKPAET